MTNKLRYYILDWADLGGRPPELAEVGWEILHREIEEMLDLGLIEATPITQTHQDELSIQRYTNLRLTQEGRAVYTSWHTACEESS